MSLLPDQELEERLSAAGESLHQPPSSLDELLKVLDQTEELLSRVSQSPARSMQAALSPLTKALISEELLKHSDVDVRVGVAACISEITRITAPDAPYDDNRMKYAHRISMQDVFQLILSSFDNLWDTSSRSHQKRVTILETVAKVRSCVMMLDLEMDQMIIEMFQHFLKSIREHHPEVIYVSMEAIMSLVMEESEYISPDLLNPILDALKKSNEQEVLPIAKKLAESVIQNGADKLKPCLEKTVNTLKASFDDYNEVVASVCQKKSSSFGHSDENILKDQPAAKDYKEDTESQDKESPEDVSEDLETRDKDPMEEVKEGIEPVLNGSPISTACNSINETREEETATDQCLLRKEEFKQQFDVKSASKTESDDMGAQIKPAQLGSKVEDVANGQAGPFKCRNGPAGSSDLVDEEKQEVQVLSHQEIPSEDTHTLPSETPLVEAEKNLDTVKDAPSQLSPLQESEIEAVNVAYPIERESLCDENQPKRSGRTKRKENVVKEDTASKKASKGTYIEEVNKKQRMMKKQNGLAIKKDKALNEGMSKNNAINMSDTEIRNLDMEAPGDVSNEKEDGSMHNEDGRGGRLVKPKSEKETSKSSATGDNEEKETEVSLSSPVKSEEDEVSPDETPKVGAKRKQAPSASPVKPEEDEVSLEETPKVGTKRKQTTVAENTPQTIRYGKNLVGSKIKVLWPDDDEFYEGVIDSYNHGTRKYKVLYTDGDVEILNLRKERWEFVVDDSALDEGESAENPGQDASSIKKKKAGNANSETSNKREKMDNPPKRKPRGNATKSGKKSKVDSKAEEPESENSEDDTDRQSNSETSNRREKIEDPPTRKPKSNATKLGKNSKADGKAEEPVSKNSEDETEKSEDDSEEIEDKSPERSMKASAKSRDGVVRTSSHKNQDNQRSTNSKGKTPQSKGKASQSGKTVGHVTKGMKKSSSSKAKETIDSGKSVDAPKGAKSQEGGNKSGKRRRK